jgi:DNA processing protein
MDERHARLALALAAHVGGTLLGRLLEAYGGASAALRASPRDLARVPGIGPETIRALTSTDHEAAVAKEVRLVERLGLTLLVWGDPEYPANLCNIPAPPPFLTVKGRLEAGDRAAVAVVGARRATAYGEQVAERLARDLAARGVTVVSGLAYGIDAAAHRGALRGRGRTLAVLGGGIGVLHPAGHRDLAEEVAGAGALISEFPVMGRPLRENFPRRNRVISGLSLGVVVVEASLTSGALITARHALEQGREVFAVPGPITARQSQGCNRLLKAGARLTEGWEDVVAELASHLRPGSPAVDPAPLPAQPLPPLTECERRIYDILEMGPLTIDAIIERLELPAGTVASALVGLEMKDLIRQHAGKRFEQLPRG